LAELKSNYYNMKPSIKIIHWMPRIICVLSILFISMFAADAFETGHTIWQQLVTLFMHLIPSFILTAILIIAWKWEFVGGIIFILIGLGTGPFIFMHNYKINHFNLSQCIIDVLMINFPFVIVGILFITSHNMKKKESISS
jgi:hypothetical protein